MRSGGAAIERAVVLTEMVTSTGVVPSKVGAAGLGEQVAALGAPVQVMVAVPVSPLGSTVSVKLAVCPAFTVAEFEEPDLTARAKSVPAPLTVMVCGLCGAL
jgi:hypothetical protein